MGVLAGCQPVREDRTVEWSRDGQDVGFQHGKEGVFVAGREGGLENVYRPGPDVLATSTPLWSPLDRRLIFTTARDPSGNADPLMPPPAEPNSEGDVQFQRPVVYTCWLRDESEADGEPRPLFEASCDHVGYVSANLAVRWHPRATSIFYVDQAAGGLGLFEFDLATQTKRSIDTRTADAIVFDWTPDGEYLVCGLGHHAPRGDIDGLWIGRADAADWWHVEQSQWLPQARLGSLLEQLRAARPAWSKDGRSFAFAAAAPSAQPTGPQAVQVWQGDLAKRKVERLAESDVPLGDLVWSPDAEHLGLVRYTDVPALHLLSRDGALSPPIGNRPVRRFAGWDAAGQSLAYVAADDVPMSDVDSWALLLIADPAARDQVIVAAADGGEGREVFSGMRVTFPRWSPIEAKLSVWFTFSPSHRSWLSRWIGLGLRPGDPAAVLDVSTGSIDWLAVNPHEQAQVGHYHLLKHRYDEAWRWYEHAGGPRPQAEDPDTADPKNSAEYVRALRSSANAALFEYVCLRNLDRDDEAVEALRRFRSAYPPKLPNLGLGGWIVDGRPLEERIQELLAPGGLTLLPIGSEEFLAGVDEALVASLAEACEAAQPNKPEQRMWWLDVALASIYGRLGQVDRQAEAIARLPSGQADECRQGIAEVRKSIHEFSNFDGWLGR
jgi:Tol biopolymer transport system component